MQPNLLPYAIEVDTIHETGHDGIVSTRHMSAQARLGCSPRRPGLQHPAPGLQPHTPPAPRLH
eukprot:scaffold126471_cov57-Phaeocystis_antarctica.AAC.2